jgi:ring-1,2-phenylacetyl-CoA epoxidase subunit PaaE
VPNNLAKNYQYIAGQNLTLKTTISGEEIRRSYSICSAPHEAELRVAVKKIPSGIFSTFANEMLKEGDVLDVMEPSGSFYTPLHPDNSNQYVGFAAGSGITPIISLIKSTLYTEPQSQFILFLGNRNTESIIFREELEQLKNKYLTRLVVHHIISGENVGAHLFRGRITGEKCAVFAFKFFDAATVNAYFLCGPESMINEVSNTLQELRVPKNRIHFELFTASSAAAAKEAFAQNMAANTTNDLESQITVILDGNAFDFPLKSSGQSILEAAQKFGAELPYACKGGVCCTCKARVLQGEVVMEVNYALEP